MRLLQSVGSSLEPQRPEPVCSDLAMKPHGHYKLRYRSTPSDVSYMDPFGYGPARAQRVIDSLRYQILQGGPDQSLRIRQIFSTPREVFRIEILETDPEYKRTTLIDRDALEDLLECDQVRERLVNRANASL